MINRVIWARSKSGKKISPFLVGTDRPLRITLHTSSFARAQLEEERAVTVLRELSNLTEVETLDTEQGGLPYINIGTWQNNDNHIPITMESENGITYSYISDFQELKIIATGIARGNKLPQSEIDIILNDLIIAQAHHVFDQDILITLSSHLLDNRDKPYFRYFNIRSPLEATKVVGLLLRSRGNYTWQVREKFRRSFDQGLFYLVLCRHRLPNMWRYLSACVQAEEVQHDNISHLGHSVMLRCVRAIEARDAIGCKFYIPQNNNTNHAIMYHFDYLTLLLAGAFDVQARVARRAYRINSPIERNTNFRNQEFLNALKNKGAKQLYDIISGQCFKDLMTLLNELRNTIHNVAMNIFISEAGKNPKWSFVRVLPEHQDLLWEAAGRYSSPERWGLFQLRDDIRLDPYTYAVSLVSECFNYIDAIAYATDITGLFPDDYDIPPLQEKAPDDEIFGENIRHRLALLG